MIEIGDDLSATAQDIVVDIEPTSRHGKGFDTVTILATSVVDDRVVHHSERHTVEPEDDDGNSFHLRINVPLRGTSLGGRWSVLVLLPRNTPEWIVDGRTTDESEVAGETLTPDTEFTRQVVAYFGEHTVVDTVWSYVRGGG